MFVRRYKKHFQTQKLIFEDIFLLKNVEFEPEMGQKGAKNDKDRTKYQLLNIFWPFFMDKCLHTIS